MKSTGDCEKARRELRRLEASWTLLTSPASFWSSCQAEASFQVLIQRNGKMMIVDGQVWISPCRQAAFALESRLA